jgi:hypothetical protein
MARMLAFKTLEYHGTGNELSCCISLHPRELGESSPKHA